MFMARIIEVNAKTGQKVYKEKTLPTVPYVRQVMKSEAKMLAEKLRDKGLITQEDVDSYGG